MIDIHCHIIPEIDDGAADFAEAVAMGEAAHRGGVTDIIVTPHCNVPNMYSNYFDEGYANAFDSLAALFREYNVGIRLHRGMEVFGTDDVGKLYDCGFVTTLAGSRYMLVEFDFSDDAWRVREVLISLLQRGVVPVIAHPERYDMVKHDIQFAFDWANMGCLLQLNRRSIIGPWGDVEVDIAHELLRTRTAHFVATDAHGVFSRTTELIEAYDCIAEHYSEDWAILMTDENPRRVLENRRIRRLPPPDGGM